MKKILLTLLLAGVITLLVGCERTNLVYNWGEYMAASLYDKFQEETNFKVRETNFDSNETALIHMDTNQYDLVIPSEYAVEQLKVENKLEKIDWDRLGYDPNELFEPELLKMIADLNAEAGYNILDYGVPYFWGTVGILYNTDTVSAEDLTGWDVLKNSKYRVSLYDSSRDSLMMALKSLGYSVNTTSEKEIEEATAWLKEIKNFVANTDQIYDDVPNDKYDLTVLYSGDAAEIYNRLESENSSLNFDFFVPDEGTNVWVDLMVIPKGANLDFAYEFIKFMLKHENALENAKECSYPSPIKSVADVMRSEATGFLYDVYNIQVRPDKDEFYRYSPENKRLVDSAWIKILADKE